MAEPDKPTIYTRQAHRAACRNPVFDWENRQDFEFASRGLLHRPDDPAITDADGVVVWHHEAFEDFLHGDAPETVHPSLWRHALLNNFRGLFKVTLDASIPDLMDRSESQSEYRRSSDGLASTPCIAFTTSSNAIPNATIQIRDASIC